MYVLNYICIFVCLNVYMYDCMFEWVGECVIFREGMRQGDCVSVCLYVRMLA